MKAPSPSTPGPPAASPPKLDLSKVRHDLRTPINHILGYCEMLQEDTQTPASFHADLRRIHAGGRQLLALITEYFDEEIFAHRRHDLFQLCHELRTPVNHIIGYGEILQEQAGDSGQEQLLPDLMKITAAARHWLALMEAYLIAPAPPSGDAPAAASALPMPELGCATPSPATAPTSPGLSGRLLVVDDDAANREMLTRRLQRQGFTVVEAASGLEALAELRAQTCDLILLDLVMSGLDGYQVLTRLKADPLLAAVPVIMVSALDQVAGIARCLEAGAEDYLAKPFDAVLLRARVNAALEKQRLRRQEAAFLQQIQQEKQRADELLHIILPRDVVAELKLAGEVKPRRFESVGVLFCDIVGFAAYSDQRPPEELLRHLQTLVEAFERIVTRHGLEKIKTIGDSFMAVAGLPLPLGAPVRACVQAGLEMIAATRAHPAGWQIRVGVHAGPVVAGIVGRMKYQFDVWGDTVNTAARVEQAGRPGMVCLSAAAWQTVAADFECERLGLVPLKGKGEVELVLIRPPLPA